MNHKPRHPEFDTISSYPPFVSCLHLDIGYVTENETFTQKIIRKMFQLLVLWLRFSCSCVRNLPAKLLDPSILTVNRYKDQRSSFSGSRVLEGVCSPRSRPRLFSLLIILSVCLSVCRWSAVVGPAVSTGTVTWSSSTAPSCCFRAPARTSRSPPETSPTAASARLRRPNGPYTTW